MYVVAFFFKNKEFLGLCLSNPCLGLFFECETLTFWYYNTLFLKKIKKKIVLVAAAVNDYTYGIQDTDKVLVARSAVFKQPDGKIYTQHFLAGEYINSNNFSLRG